MAAQQVSFPNEIKMIEGILQGLAQRADTLAAARDNEKRQGGRRTPFLMTKENQPDQLGVISILGDRGAGKTTLIRELANQLNDKSDCLVLPPITPLDFYATGSLFSYVLAMIEHEVLCDAPAGREVRNQRCGGDAENNENTFEKLKKKIAAVRDDVARTVELSLKALVQAGSQGADFGYHFVSIQDKHYRAKRDYPELIELLLQELSKRRNLEPMKLLVLMLDDCDLYPELLHFVLLDIQRLCDSPRVAIVFGVNEQRELCRIVGHSLLSGMNNGFYPIMQSSPFVSDTWLKIMVDLYVQKIFPVSQQINLKKN